MSSIKCIYTPTPCQVLRYIDWNYEPPSHEELIEGSTMSNKGVLNPMWGKTTSDKQKAAVAKAASKRFKGVPKWYKTHTPIMHGSDNPRARKIYAEGKEYDTIKECCDAYGFKYHHNVRYRLNHDKWTEWYYL